MVRFVRQNRRLDYYHIRVVCPFTKCINNNIAENAGIIYSHYKNEEKAKLWFALFQFVVVRVFCCKVSVYLLQKLFSLNNIYIAISSGAFAKLVYQYLCLCWESTWSYISLNTRVWIQSVCWPLCAYCLQTRETFEIDLVSVFPMTMWQFIRQVFGSNGLLSFIDFTEM